MRIIGFFLVAAGLLAIVATGFVDYVSRTPTEIGRFNVFTQYTGYKTAEAELGPGDAPLRIVLEAAIPLETRHTDGETTLTLVVNSASRTIATETPLISPDTASVTETGTVVVEVLEIPRLEDGPYTFVLGEGDRDELRIVSAHLVLERLPSAADRFSPIGFTLLAVGVAILVLGWRRRRSPPDAGEPASGTSSIGYRQPESRDPVSPSVDWGRGDGTG
ncbi:hypothetical protein [Oricola sp.]|uniref:hypothetical protein n=1 Tax=Oricola sp. TaxID=1979950 RepID=UPI003BAC7306